MTSEDMTPKLFPIKWEKQRRHRGLVQQSRPLQFDGEHKGLFGLKQGFAGVESLKVILEKS